MNLPGAHLDIPALNEKDEFDINEFAVKFSIDMIAISLVRSSDNIDHVRDMLQNSEQGKKIKILAKIENAEGLNNFEEILAVSDGIIIMRQSLSLELSPEKVYLA